MRKISQELKEHTKPFAAKFKRLLKYVSLADKIIIFRHSRPDFDAYGSQLGLYYFLKDNFPNKQIKFVGEHSGSINPDCFERMENVSDDFISGSLGIIVDTADKKRISDDRYKLCKTICKIDHHPDLVHFGKVSIVDTECVAASELIAMLILSAKGDFIISDKCAEALFKGMVGDSNRFVYEETTPLTFEVARELMRSNFSMKKAYDDMYLTTIEELKFKSWVLSNFKVSEKGIIYYIIDEQQLKELNIPSEMGKEGLGFFEHIKGSPIYICVTFDPKKKEYKVSLRSRGIAINQIANKYRGGGHPFASGATIYSLDEFPKIIKDLEALL